MRTRNRSNETPYVHQHQDSPPYRLDDCNDRLLSPVFLLDDSPNDDDRWPHVPISEAAVSLGGVGDDGELAGRFTSSPGYPTIEQIHPVTPGSPALSGQEHLGHVRAPIVAREPSMLETFSRTMRTYVPSSIRVPTPAPTSPRISRPASLGSIMSRGHAGLGVAVEDFYVSEEEDNVPRSGRGLTSYPGEARDDGETIVWARWDTLARSGCSTTQLLLLAYQSGIQIWDCTNLSSIREILNLTGPSWRHISFAAVLPHLPASSSSIEEEPLLGLVLDDHLLLYSLQKHHIVKRLSFPSINNFSANQHFIVISTTHPASLHILSALTFATLFIIPTTELIPFSFSLPSFASEAEIVPVTPPDLDHHHTVTPTLVQMRAVYALSRRLLAYVSPAPLPSSPRVQPRARWLLDSDLGNAAIKVGESVLSGIKTLGDLAYNAAATKANLTARDQILPAVGRLLRGASSSSGQDRRDSSGSSHDARTPSSDSRRPSSAGYFVTILDLAPLRNGNAGPTVVSEFIASKHQAITDLYFSADGTSLIVVPKDGQAISVFQIRPGPRNLFEPSSADNPILHIPVHLYSLRRGLTTGVINGVNVAHDLRWIAIGTQNRTIHVFAVNPYGGKPDNRSHLEGTVRNNIDSPTCTELSSIARLRVHKSSTRLPPVVPLAFTFIQSPCQLFPGNLVSATSPHTRLASLPSGSSRGGFSEPLSPRNSSRSHNVQDILVFDPTDGVLTLKRLTVELRSRDSIVNSLPALGTTSASLPGMGGAAWLGTSPPTTVNRQAEVSPDLTAKEMALATWNLKRKGHWKEIRGAVEIEGPERSRVNANEWLAQAELSTCSSSAKILPRPIYLSHQFFFYALGEDYHALIRRQQLDINGTKLEVRKEVEVSAYPAGSGESFVEGFASQRTIYQAPSSIDEPLALALTGDLDYPLPAQPIIPMLPNGIGSKPKSFKGALPIRAMAAGLSDGMSERLEKMRRAKQKPSPPSIAPSDSGVSVPVTLEFDEEDEEDFVKSRSGYIPSPGGISHSKSREGDSGASMSLSTPSTTPPLFLDDEAVDDIWNDWGVGTATVDDNEEFHHVSAVGLLDEEQTPAIKVEKNKPAGRRSKKSVHR